MNSTRVSGFTLIEMLTVIAIITIIMGVLLFSGPSRYKDTINLETDASNLATLIRTARQKSITVAEYNGTFPSYGVYVRPGETPVLYQVVNPNITNGNTMRYFTTMAPVEPFMLKGGSTISSVEHSGGGNFSQGASVLFVRPIPSIYIMRHTGNNGQIRSAGTLNITLSLNGDTRKVSVNSNGLVEVGY